MHFAGLESWGNQADLQSKETKILSKKEIADLIKIVEEADSDNNGNIWPREFSKISSIVEQFWIADSFFDNKNNKADLINKIKNFSWKKENIIASHHTTNTKTLCRN